MQSLRAVSLCNNDFDKSITFLQTGQYSQEEPFQLPLSYMECPLLFYVLEILNSILDLQDHCAMCGESVSWFFQSLFMKKICFFLKKNQLTIIEYSSFFGTIQLLLTIFVF